MFVILPHLFANGVGGNENGPLGHGVLRGPWSEFVHLLSLAPQKPDRGKNVPMRYA
jgi:hypothetical protein